MVMTYALLLIILLLAEIAGVITGFVLRDQLTVAINDEMVNTQMNFSYTANNTEALAWNNIQREFQCCGTAPGGFLSWSINKELGPTFSVPDSCCKMETVGCGVGKRHNETQFQKLFYEQNCYDAVVHHLKYYLVAVGAIAAAVALLELIGIVFACCLAGHLRKDYRVV